MSYRYMNHLTNLHKTVRAKPEYAAFKVPADNKSGWRDITYKEFWDDVTRLAVCWSKWLNTNGEKRGKVVGLWMAGETYTDALHIFSLLRVGYIPCLMWTYIKDVDVIQSQFEEANARIVACDTKIVEGWKQLEKAGIKVIPFSTFEEIIENASPTVDLSILPPLDVYGNGDDIILIAHSSGSTSGRPKVVKWTRRWIDANAQKSQIIGKHQKTQVMIRGGSFCNTSQIIGSLGIFLHAQCIVLTPTLVWEADELANIITQYDILEKAKTSVLLRERLKTLNSLTYMGGPLGARAVESANEMGIKIICGFGSTEVGAVMSGQPVPGRPLLLKFCSKFDCELIPVKDENGDNTTLHELVVLPTSPDCPIPALRDPMDGKYHTKDLFEIVEDGYIPRGRKSDSLLLDNYALCDAKYIEDKISYLCRDLLSSFVVVGQGRPCPALLAEPQDESNITSTIFRKTLLTRLEPLNSSKIMGYQHERIKPECVIILPKGSLPILPGKETVVRSKAESMFKEMLDRMIPYPTEISLKHAMGTCFDLRQIKTVLIISKWIYISVSGYLSPEKIMEYGRATCSLGSSLQYLTPPYEAADIQHNEENGKT
ncbi:hypothetical protein Clacol_003313 [Clathrus columnatus]|uniref:AMP-dependent synthetase/ligase domain-containing protein n=1 Tax=Clathrus columnatus TaxID=1419009 RepID=A0AAV5A351_9AGAM|nr:hypothetical protein Clacol_003313 [Clathrus columnatus]